LFQDQLSLIFSLDGPFSKAPEDDDPNFAKYPHLRGVLSIQDGLIPGVHISGSYDKRYLRTLKDIVDPKGAVIGAEIGVSAGPAVISLVYSLRYDPSLEGDENWEITSGLTSSLSLF
jgi:hypothetical protein